MQVYFEPEQAFSINMPQPVFEISITYKKKHVSYVEATTRFDRPLINFLAMKIVLYFCFLLQHIL